MSRNYYYLVAGLPDLFLDQETKDFNIDRILEEFQEHLNPKDYELIQLINLPFDNENFLNFVLQRNKEFSSLGMFKKELYEELNENILLFPKYFQDFYASYTGKTLEEENAEEADDLFEEERVEKGHEVRFYELFFDYICKQDNWFISKWFTYLFQLQNILSAISCRTIGIDAKEHLVGKGELIEALTRSQAPDFGLKRDIDYIDKLISITEIPDIMERERRIDLLKWDMVNELTLWEYFSTEYILGFMVKAQIVYRWSKLDSKVGQEMFKKLMADLRKTYAMPSDFNKK
jgi:hypothetical protein